MWHQQGPKIHFPLPLSVNVVVAGVQCQGSLIQPLQQLPQCIPLPGCQQHPWGFFSKVCVLGTEIAIDMEVQALKVFSDSKLMVNQLNNTKSKSRSYKSMSTK